MHHADKSVVAAIEALDLWVLHDLMRLQHEAYSECSRLEVQDAANLTYMLRQQLVVLRGLWEEDAELLQTACSKAQM